MITDAHKDYCQQISAQEEEYIFPYHYVTAYHNGQFKQHFVDIWGINYATTLEFVIQRVQNITPVSLIDIGCGDGRLTRELCLHSRISKLHGVDLSTRAIGLAQAMNSDHPEIIFSSTDITTDHGLGYFDAAVLMEVFEHIPVSSCDAFMAGVRRLIKENGKLLMTVPHSNKALEYKHFQHFTADHVRRYVEPYFKIDEVIPFERITWRRRLLDRLLCNRWFVLNNTRLLNTIYRYHKRQLFICRSEAECQRLYVEATAI